jgi:hypothetical protein
MSLSPREHVDAVMSVLDNLPAALLSAARIVLGGSEVGACLALRVVEAKSTGVGAGSLAGAVAGSFDMFCAGALLVDPFVGWRHQSLISTEEASRPFLDLKLLLKRSAYSVTRSHVCEWFPVAHTTTIAPPLKILTAVDSMWEAEQTLFFMHCAGGGSSSFSNDVSMRQYTIAATTSSTGSCWLRRWETTDVEVSMGEVEMWLRDKGFPLGSRTATPRAGPADRHHPQRVSGFQPITPARDHARGVNPSRGGPNPSSSSASGGPLVDFISGENIHELSAVVRRLSAAEGSAARTLHSIPLVNSYSSVDEF